MERKCESDRRPTCMVTHPGGLGESGGLVDAPVHRMSMLLETINVEIRLNRRWGRSHKLCLLRERRLPMWRSVAAALRTVRIGTVLREQ